MCHTPYWCPFWVLFTLGILALWMWVRFLEQGGTIE